MRGTTKTEIQLFDAALLNSARCSSSSQVRVKDKNSSHPFSLSTSSSAANLPSVGPINKLTQHLTNFKLVTTPQLGVATASGRHGNVNLQVT
jgi:hypothetical protein